MATQIRHTKQQENTYHKQIKKLVLDPLTTTLTTKLARAADNASAWQFAIDSTFGDPDYQGDVENGSELLASKQINFLSKWHENKIETQFKQLFGIDIMPLLNENRTKEVLDPIITDNIALIRSISPELHDQVNEQYMAILSEHGFDQQKTLKMLTQRFSVSNSRAKLIATDQNNKTIGALQKTRQNQAGVKHFIWRTSEDERVRSSHAELDGKVFRWDVLPPEGMPGQPIRCRCVAIPWIQGVS
jgi:SPP1 gp7 family putative phage head morphogenesis protein